MSPMRGSANLRWRAALAAGSVLLLLLYSRQNSQTRASLAFLQSSLTACQQNGESAIAKLKVIYEHKQRMQELYQRTRNESAKNAQETNESLRRCELNHLDVKERLKSCEERISAKDEVAGHLAAPTIANQAVLNSLYNQMKELESLLNETRTQLQEVNKENALIKNNLADCAAKLQAQDGGVIPKSNYTLNESAHFERVHRKEEKLEFRRDDNFEAPVLLNARDLVKKLEEKKLEKIRKEENEKHPQEREENDEYVAEKPNEKEEDYKEGGHK